MEAGEFWKILLNLSVIPRTYTNEEGYH